MIAVVHSDKRCARGSVVVVVVGTAVVVDAGTVVVVTGAIVVVGVVVGMVVVGVVRTAVIGATTSVTHSSFVEDDVTTPRSKMGAIAITDKLCVDDRTNRTRAVPAMTAKRAKIAAKMRSVFPPVIGKSQTFVENIYKRYPLGTDCTSSQRCSAALC